MFRLWFRGCEGISHQKRQILRVKRTRGETSAKGLEEWIEKRNEE